MAALSWQSTPVLGTIPIHTFPPPQMLFRTFGGFCCSVSRRYKTDSCKYANIFHRWFVVARGLSGGGRDVFITWESKPSAVIQREKEKQSVKAVDWIKMTSRLITLNRHVIVAFVSGWPPCCCGNLQPGRRGRVQQEREREQWPVCDLRLFHFPTARARACN